MNLFPSGWRLPLPKGFKPINNLSDHHFPYPKTLRISAPVSKPVKFEIPACEMLRPGEEVDLTQVDELVADLFDDSQDAKSRRVMQVISMITGNLEKNIKVIENAPAVESDNISRKDLLKLLKGFHNLARTFENYIKEQAPSLR